MRQNLHKGTWAFVQHASESGFFKYHSQLHYDFACVIPSQKRNNNQPKLLQKFTCSLQNYHYANASLLANVPSSAWRLFDRSVLWWIAELPHSFAPGVILQCYARSEVALSPPYKQDSSPGWHFHDFFTGDWLSEIAWPNMRHRQSPKRSNANRPTVNRSPTFGSWVKYLSYSNLIPNHFWIRIGQCD